MLVKKVVYTTNNNILIKNNNKINVENSQSFDIRVTTMTMIGIISVTKKTQTIKIDDTVMTISTTTIVVIIVTVLFI